MAAFKAPIVVLTASFFSCSPPVPTSGEGDNILTSMVVLPSGGERSMVANVTVSFGDDLSKRSDGYNMIWRGSGSGIFD